MAGESCFMFFWNWTEASVLSSQVFGQALMESCDIYIMIFKNIKGKVQDLSAKNPIFFQNIYLIETQTNI